MIEALEKASTEKGVPMLCAKRRDGSWVIYIAPGATDPMGLMVRASIEIEKDRESTAAKA